MSGDPELFAITKRLGNNLYGMAGDGGPLGAAEREHYRRASDANAAELARLVRPGDVVFLHDFQTVGLVEHARRMGAVVVWRCHVGSDGPNEHTTRAWRFLRPWLRGAEALVFSTQRHVPDWVDGQRARVVAPSIHPFAPKNLSLDGPTVRALLQRTGLLAGDSTAPVRVLEPRGGDGEIVVRRRATVVGDGPPPAPETPLVVQVSRWDRLKDMLGVMEAFLAAPGARDARLALVGPSG
jgi:trehalose synthase